MFSTFSLFRGPYMPLRTLLLLFAGFLYWPGFLSLPPMDRDEPRFAQASKQMYESGEYASIHYREETRYKKPIGIYWLQSASVAIGDAMGVQAATRSIWLYRLPSLVGALLSVLLTYEIGRLLGSRTMAFGAALLFASTILLGVEARLAKTDAVLLALILAAMLPLARVWQNLELRPWHWILFWGALAGGFLIKGPIVLLVPLSSLLALIWFQKSAVSLRKLHFVKGICLFFVLVLPWFVFIVIQTKGGFLVDSVGTDMLQKVAGGVESHGAWPGYYVLVSVCTTWPLAPFFLLAVPALYRARREPILLFLLTWLLPTWMLLELIPTKLPHYILPLVPAGALLAAWAWMEKDLVLPGRTFYRVTLLLIPGMAASLLLVIMGLALFQRDWPGPFFFLASMVAWPFIFSLFYHIWSCRLPPSAFIWPSVALAFCIYWGVYQGVFVSAISTPFQLSSQMQGIIERVSTQISCSLTPIVVGYREPSFVFLSSQPVLFADSAQEALRLLQEQVCGAAILERNEKADVSSLKEVGRVRGINLNKPGFFDYGIYLEPQYGKK